MDVDYITQKDREALRKARRIEIERENSKMEKKKELIRKNKELRKTYMDAREGEDKIGGYPYSVIKKYGKSIIRFRPKSQFALNPERVIFSITLDKEDTKKFKDLLD